MRNVFMLKMRVVLVLFVVVETINKTDAKSVLRKEVNKRDVAKALSPSSYEYVITRRQNFSAFPNMPYKRNNFVVNFNPEIKSDSQTNKPEQKRNHMMKKLSIKYIDYNRKAKIPLEITTRRSLMQKMKFTVKPHDVYAESVREKYNWYANRKVSRYNLKRSEGKKDNTENSFKFNNEEDSLEERFKNFKNVDENDIDSSEFGELGRKNSYVAAGSQKTKTILLFPKRNNSRYLKVNKKQGDVQKYVSDMKIYSKEQNNQSYDDQTIKEKGKPLPLRPSLFIKSDSMDKNKVIKPQDNFAVQEEKDQDEFIFVKDVNKNEMSLRKPSVAFDDDEISTDSNLDIFV